MKNSNSFLRQIMAFKFGRWLPLVMVFFLASCQKENALVQITEIEKPSTLVMVTDRSSQDDNVVQVINWLVTNASPLIKDEKIVQDISNGNYTSAHLQNKLRELGFDNYVAFSQELATRVGPIPSDYFQQISSNTNVTATASLLNQIDLTPISDDIVGRNSPGSTSGAPCYDQMRHAMLFLMADVAIVLANDGWEAAAATALVGAARIRIAYNDCIESQY